MEDGLRVVIVVLGIAIVLSIGTAIFDELSESQGTYDRIEHTELLGDTGDFQEIGIHAGTNETVFDSRGHAAVLDGSDSFSTSSDVTFADDTDWTVSTWANVDAAGASERRAVIDIDGHLVIYYDGPNTQWQAWYYDEADRDSYLVNVSAANQPGNFSNIKVWSDGSTLRVYRNNTVGESVDLTVDSHADANLTADDFHGSIDEVRVFDDALDVGNRTALTNSPVGPVDDTNRTLRIMFDEPDQDTQLAFFAASDVTLSGVSIGDGLEGNELSEGSDYDWKDDGPEIAPLAGGLIDGAPVAYVDYDNRGAIAGTVDGWADFVGIAILIGVAAIAVAIATRMRAA